MSERAFSAAGEKYVQIWRGFLTHLAGWNEAKIGRLVDYWRDCLEESGEDAGPSPLFHELPWYWITFELIPPAERSVESSLWREVDKELKTFSGWLAKDPRLKSYAWSAYDWDVLRRSIDAIFVRYGYPPGIDPSWPQYW